MSTMVGPTRSTRGLAGFGWGFGWVLACVANTTGQTGPTDQTGPTGQTGATGETGQTGSTGTMAFEFISFAT